MRRGLLQRGVVFLNCGEGLAELAAERSHRRSQRAQHVALVLGGNLFAAQSIPGAAIHRLEASTY